MTKIRTTIGDDAENIVIMMHPPEDRTPRAIWPAGVSWHREHTTKWAGSFNIRLPSQREHEVVFRALDGLSISIGGHHSVARVTNDFGGNFTHPAPMIADTANGGSSS